MKPTAGHTDQGFDRMVGRSLASAPSPAEECPSADILAAWVDRALAPSECAAVDLHLSSCGRCQQIVAAIAETEPVELPARAHEADSRGWLWHWRWAVPLATAALIVVIVGNRTMQAPSELESRVPIVAGQQATEAMPPAAPPPIASSPRLMTKAEVPSPPPDSRFARERVEDVVPPLPKGDAAANASSRSKAASAPLPRVGNLPEERGQLAGGVAGGVVGGVVGGMVGALPEVAPSVVAPQAQPSAPAPTATETRTVTAPPQAADKSTANFAADANASRQAADARRFEATPSSTSLVVLSAPGSPVAWRYGDGGVVERTPDGQTWVRQVTGVTSSLLAGWAVSSRICWIVGRDGVVLRTTDGLTWQRITPPTKAHLVAVFAYSADAASVRTADGREFVTTDGGATWSSR